MIYTIPMGWRLHSRDAQGKENVAFAATLQDAVAGARELLVQGQAILRIESDDGEIVEGKQLQEALTARRPPGTMH